MSASSDLLPDPVLAFLRRAGLARPDETPPATVLTGGVSSDIWKVELAGGPVCVKRALPRLRVEQRWEAPVERNRYEWRWMQAAARIVPGAAPRVLARRHPCEHRTGAVALLDRPIGLWESTDRAPHRHTLPPFRRFAPAA